MDVLILIPVDPREAQDRRANKDYDGQRQENQPTRGLMTAGRRITHQREASLWDASFQR
jgi:hypothetical protein